VPPSSRQIREVMKRVSEPISNLVTTLCSVNTRPSHINAG
jgi:hypothetical protein